MIGMVVFGIILGAVWMAGLAWFIDSRKPSPEQQLRVYERRQRFIAQQERLRMHATAIALVKEMLRQQNRRRF